MALLKPAKHQQAYAKVGVYGFQGSGKTHTAMLIAKGMAKLIKTKKIAFFETETGSDWWADRFPKDMELLVAKSQTYTDLMTTIRECEEGGIKILVVDSITHVWNNLIDEYMDKKNLTFLRFSDWKPIKRAWAKYTTRFVNSEVHIIVCGRAGNEYDQVKNEKGKLEPVKTGTKMKAENEFNFEPHLVIEMEIDKTENGLKNVAQIRKDRSDTINGKAFSMPTFENFKSHFDALKLGGKHSGIKKGKQDEFKEPSGSEAVEKQMGDPF